MQEEGEKVMYNVNVKWICTHTMKGKGAKATWK